MACILQPVTHNKHSIRLIWLVYHVHPYLIICICGYQTATSLLVQAGNLKVGKQNIVFLCFFVQTTQISS